MKRPAGLLFAAHLASVVAGAGSGFATAAEIDATRQVLVTVTAAEPVMSAVWQKHPDSWTLKIVLDRSRYVAMAERPASRNPMISLTAEDKRKQDEEMRKLGKEMGRLGIVNVADTLLTLVPQQIAGLPTPTLIREGQGAGDATIPVDRYSRAFFKGVTDLLGVEPTYVCGKELRVAAWLLKADGSYVPQMRSTCSDAGSESTLKTEVSLSYAYPAADGAQAIAAVFKINGMLYVDKLQPPAAAPAVRQR